MKKSVKIAVIVLAALVVAVAAVTLLVKSYLTEERMRALVSEMVEKSLNRKTLIGAIDISLFKGIVVKDFEIKEKDGTSPFVKTKEFVLTYEFFPLLSKKLIIDKLAIVDAEIYVKTNPDGTYNFSDMAKPAATPSTKEDREKAAGLPVTLNVKDIAIKNAKLSYAAATGGLQKADVIANADLKIAAPSPNALSSSGSFDVTLAQVIMKDGKSYKDLKATVSYKIDADLAAKALTIHSIDLDVMKIPVNVTGKVAYGEVPDINLAVKSKSIALDSLLPAAPAGAKSQEPGGGKDKTGKTAGKDETGKEPEPMNLKLKANVSVDIDKITYKGISITNFTSRYELKDNVLTIPYLKGNTLSGAFALKGAVDLAQKGYRYGMNMDLNGVKVEEIINAFAPKARDTLFGALSGKAAITGAGTLPVNVKRNLKGKGEFTIKNGTLKNAELAAGLLTILGLRDMKEIPIDKADSRFAIAGGVVNLISQLGNKDMIIDEAGTIGLDERLDLGVVVKVSDRLSPKIVSQSQIGSFLSAGEKGWTGVPLKVTGTVSKPSYGIDTKAVGKKLGEGLQKKAGEELQRLLSPDQKKPAGKEQKKSTGAEDLIKGIFGK
jgi:uncharacterized protein involved in outer membrane biogenesis